METATFATLRAISTDRFLLWFSVLKDCSGNTSPGISPIHTERICVFYGMSLIVSLFFRTA